MVLDKLKDLQLILASGSPRRQEFFKAMHLNFEVRVKPVEEVYPDHLRGPGISDYLAQLKAQAFKGGLKPGEIVITSDTVVWYKDRSLAKPKDREEAFQMLRSLSNDWHEVISSVCFTSTDRQETINSTTKVKFKALTDEEIWFYIDHYQPFDKAGAYGIQEWIGHMGVEEIQGSYTNVMGLPTHLVYKTLIAMVS
ncbi:Maf-like protein [Spongiimicrobium sp. 2-473A-2-J]|uniref:Maf-like protein n=1 Tax=Eudoraea algarum TaxID=3417568 RepID=UPI003D361390